MTQIDKPKKVFFLGIGGTGMASVAGLAQSSGFDVSGSDGQIYPPMSTMLQELKIPTFSGYSPENLRKAEPDLVVVANALSRGNDELEFMLASEIPYTSFPAFLGDHFLKQKEAVVVTGTHGKTTTTSMISNGLWCLLTYRDAWTQINKRPELLANALEETMRYETAISNPSRCVRD